MKLYICEKPKQAKAVAKILNIKTNGKHYFGDNDILVTWCVGHLLELFKPDDYDSNLKKWSTSQLPIIPEKWRYHVRRDALSQYKQIGELIKKADVIGIATDYDREGEAIARSLLDRFRYSKEIIRYPITALDDHSLKKALNNPISADETIKLYFAQIARSRADWLVGMNLSRLFTCLAQTVGYRDVLNIGRVITPMVGIVVERDLAIANFVPKPYWDLAVTVAVQNGQFNAKWVPPSSIADESGRCTNPAYIQNVVNQLKHNRAGIIAKSESTSHYESAPLPFDLTSLQQYCAKRFDYSAAQVLDAAQSLYETHMAITYPRADTRYLPESMHDEVHDVLKALILSDNSITGAVSGACPDIKSRAFKTSKVNAHHAIIPTMATVDISKFKETEMNIYNAVRLFYIAQFYQPYHFQKTVIEAKVNNELFSTTGKTPLKPGWKLLINHDFEVKDITTEAEDINDDSQQLPKVNSSEPAQIASGNVSEKQTKAPPHFTEATLLGAMEHVERYVPEPVYKKILKERSGLGTVATRASTIEKAKDANLLKREKKKILSTDKAQTMHKVLPSTIRSAGMTAAWELELEKIASGELAMTTFMVNLKDWLSQLIGHIQNHEASLTHAESDFAKSFKLIAPEKHHCFKCGSEVRRRKGKNGFFWSCTGTHCKTTFNDEKGKPVEREEKNCPKCKRAMYVRKGKKPGAKRASRFWGCSGYPDCSHTEPYRKQKNL